MDVIKVSYGEFYAIDDSFDLNQLRKLKRVKRVSDGYVPEKTTSCIEIEVGANVITKKENVDDAIIKELEEKTSQYQKWWNDERAAKAKVDEELKCLKLTISNQEG